MKNVCIILLLVVCVFCLAFTAESLMTVKPAVPKQITVESFFLASKAQEYVNQKLTDGWVLKTWEVDKVHFIIMEKY